MKKRVITGIVYVLVMIGLIAMKIFIPVAADGLEYGALGIDIMFELIAVIAALEFIRAVKDVSKAQRLTAIVTCALIIPVFVIVKMVTIKFWGEEYANNMGGPALIAMLAVVSIGAMTTASLTVFDHYNSDLKSTAYAELCIIYCGTLTAVGPNINHMMNNSSVAILLLFAIVPAVDSSAFLFGSLFGKLIPLKLAPKTSPNKTVIGAIGGVIGGLVTSVLVWLVCEYSGIERLQFVYTGDLPKWLILMLIAFPTAILSQLGDLFESAIKRGCGVKDMGRILPGHGGILDRFDSMLFATVSIVVCFMVL